MTSKKSLIQAIETSAQGTSFEVIVPFLSTMKTADLLVLNQKVLALKEDVKVVDTKFESTKSLETPVMMAIQVTCRVLEKKLVSKKTIKTALEENGFVVEYKEIEGAIDTLIKAKKVCYLRNAESKVPFYGLTKLGQASLNK